MSSRKIIEIANVIKRFGANNGHGYNGVKPCIRTNAVDGISLFIEKNSTTLIKGPNGAGKTTLLTIIGGLARPTSGRVLIDKTDISCLPENFLSAVRNNYFGFIFQNNHLISGISVLENIMVPAYTSGKKPKQIRLKALELTEKLKITSLAGQKIENLSGGEQQRVAIARALVNDPAVIIADEPTAHLHPDLAVEFVKVVSQMIEEGKSVIISSHDSMLINSGIVNRVIKLSDGKVVDDVKMLAN